MKLLLISAVIAGLFFTSCGGGSSTTITSDDGKTKVSVDPTQAANTADEMQKKVEELKKLSALTVDQLKAMLPQELMGMKRSSFNATAMMGYATGEAEYKKDDTTSLKLAIIDCAGEAGSAIYGLSYWTKMSLQSESDNGYTKTVDFMGQKSVESYEKSNNMYSEVFVASDRLLVTINGQNTGLDIVKQAAQGLNLKVN